MHRGLSSLIIKQLILQVLEKHFQSKFKWIPSAYFALTQSIHVFF